MVHKHQQANLYMHLNVLVYWLLGKIDVIEYMGGDGMFKN